MKGWRIVSVLLLSLVLVGATACNALGGSEEEVTEQLESLQLESSTAASPTNTATKDQSVTCGTRIIIRLLFKAHV